jgi:hypothetical protein
MLAGWSGSLRSSTVSRTPTARTKNTTRVSALKSASTSSSRSSNVTGVHLAKLQSDLREFIALLNAHNVEYMVVGGHAVAFHGYPRFTGDIDFFLRPTRDNASRVIDALHAFGFASLMLEPEDLTAPERVVQLGRPPDRIDLLTSISGVKFEDAWSARVAGELDEQPVYFLGWDALVENKRACDREKDRLDLKTLLAIAARKSGSQGV